MVELLSNNPKPGRKRSLRWIKWPIILLVLAGAGYAAYTFWPREEEVVESRFGQSAVTRGDLSKAVQGSGNIQPSVNRTVTVSDDVTITKLHVGEGDTVEAGGALAEVDHETLRDTIQSQEDQIAQKELEIERARNGFDSYSIAAPRSGRIRELHAKVGEDAADTAKAYGALCLISTGGKMKATLEVIEEISYDFGPTPTATQGQSNASETSSGWDSYWTWWFPNGTVTLVKGDVISVSVDGETMNASVTALSNGSITVELPGDTYAIGAKVFYMAPWGVERIAEGELELSESVQITGNGKISGIHIQDGQMIDRGDTMFSLDETDARLSLEGQQLSLDQLRDSLDENETKLDEDKLTSPIDGTIVELLVEEGNTVKSGEAFVRIMDATTMELTIAVDELDISEVRTGMDAKISIDAFEEEEFSGVVKSIGIIGTTSNSVTTYEVVVSMDGESKIKPAMSATADIVIEESKDALLVPVEALVKQNERYFARIPVEVSGEDGAQATQGQARTRSSGESGERPGTSPQAEVLGPEASQRPQSSGTQGARPSGAPNAQGPQASGSQGARPSGAPNAQGPQSSGSQGARPSGAPNMPGGAGGMANAEFTLVPVEIGLVNDTYAEVLDGLSEGDIVLVPRTSTTQSGMNFGGGSMMGMMGGSGGPSQGGGGGGGGPRGG